jgi:hypothetical protein
MNSVLRRGHKKGVTKRRNLWSFFASSWKLGAQCYCDFHPYVSMLTYCIQRIGKSMSSLGANYSLLDKGINKTSKDHSNQDTGK